jgi:hypothetical protein
MTARRNSSQQHAYSSIRATVGLPFPHDIDVAPQLIAVALAQAALAGAHRALDSAHPALGLWLRAQPGPALTDTEYLAALVLHAADHLAALLRDYDAAIVHDNGTLDEPQFPF